MHEAVSNSAGWPGLLPKVGPHAISLLGPLMRRSDWGLTVRLQTGSPVIYSLIFGSTLWTFRVTECVTKKRKLG